MQLKKWSEIFHRRLIALVIFSHKKDVKLQVKAGGLDFIVSVPPRSEQVRVTQCSLLNTTHARR